MEPTTNQSDQNNPPEQPETTATSAAPQTPTSPPLQTPPTTQTTTSLVADDPGKSLGIIGFIFAFIMPLVGLIISIIARSKSKKSGHSNGLALAGIIVSSVFMIIGIISITIVIIAVVSVVQKCQELGPGTHIQNGTTYTCS